MTINVVDPGYMWWPWLALAGVVAILVAFAVIANKYDWDNGSVWGAFVFLAFMVGICGSILVGFSIDRNWEEAYNESVVKSLEDEGFTGVILTEGREHFIADWEGEYFMGSLIETGTDEFLVVDMKNAAKEGP